jgi:preprotein translocase subunit SecA
MFTDEELGIEEEDVFGEMSSLLAAFGDGNFDSEDDEYYEDDYEDKAVRLASPRNETFVNTDKKVGRNDPCPCGSGKKYKKCHGKK